MDLDKFSRIILRLVSDGINTYGENVRVYNTPGLMETELAVRIFRRASSLGIPPCRRYGVGSRKLGRAESSETFCREGKVGLKASSLFVVSFSCSKCEWFMVKVGSRESNGNVKRRET